MFRKIRMDGLVAIGNDIEDPHSSILLSQSEVAAALGSVITTVSPGGETSEFGHHVAALFGTPMPHDVGNPPRMQ